MSFKTIPVNEQWPLVPLGDLITELTQRNRDAGFGADAVRGIATSKEFIDTKADLTGVNLDSYKIVASEHFAFVADTSRRGERISLAFNDSEESYLVSSISTVFMVKDHSVLLPEFLQLHFRRAEFDRYARFNSWGSARETFTWDDMCRVKIPLPPIEVQKSYVEAYKGLTKLIEENQTLVRTLEKTAQICVLECREKWPFTELKTHIKKIDVRNKDNSIKAVKGLSVTKQFREPTSKVDKENLANYKIVEKDQFAFVQTTNNEKCLVVCLSLYDHPIVVSSVNEVFEITDTTLLPEFLYLMFKKPEFDRYARFHSWGSARETFSWDDMCRVKVPLPPIETQKAIVALFHCAENARAIAEKAKAQLAAVCPAMIQRASVKTTA